MQDLGQASSDAGERGEIYKEDDIIYYYGTNYQGIRQYGSHNKSPIVNSFELILDTEKNVLSAKFIFPAKQYKSLTDGKIEFKVDLEQEKLLLIQVDEFQGYRDFEKLGLSENEILTFSKRIHKRFLGHIEALGDDL